MEIPTDSRSPSDVPPFVSACVRVRASTMMAVVLALMSASLQAGADGTLVDGYQLKAVFLFNFAKFVEWPPLAFGDSCDPFTICVAGDDSFGSALDDEVRGKTVANRPILVRLVSGPAEARKCQILFVSPSERKRERALLDALKGASVLTVGDTDDFTANGGIVRFKIKDARVRIEIDAAAAARASLRISSRLLSLAEPSGN
jgi:hypothetical protein